MTKETIIMVDHIVDLEEAVGSYLNCLSTSCAAGSKLYTSVGKIVDDKFQELFPSQETKLLFQTLQTQNAFEGYQKALLECKDKLLEILIDSHTRRQPAKDNKNRQGKSKSTEEVNMIYFYYVCSMYTQFIFIYCTVKRINGSNESVVLCVCFVYLSCVIVYKMLFTR